MLSLVDMAAAKEAAAEKREATAAAMEVAAMVVAMVVAAMEMRWGWRMEEREPSRRGELCAWKTGASGWSW